MNAINRKSLYVALLLTISGAACAAEPAVAVNTEGMPAYLAAKVEAKAAQGYTELRRFLWRTRMIYAVDMASIVRG